MTDRLNRINAFLRDAAASTEFGQLFGNLCEALKGDGVPLWRAAISYRTLDPLVRARTTVWQRDDAAAEHETGHQEGERQFLASPIRHLLERQLLFGRWRLEHGEGREFPVLSEFLAAGATDYTLHLVLVDAGTPELPGVAISFASDRQGGFCDGDLAELAAMVPAIGLAGGRALLVSITRSVLGLYLGPRTARLVLDGEIRRGLGRNIDAAILLADLRGFTRLAESSDPQTLVACLDERLAAMTEAVTNHGGEVLKFLGDGLLAVFPVEAAEGADALEAARREACRQALQAAEAAQAANATLNETDKKAGAPTLDLDIALHYGEVIYGNVGSPHRLDFTVVGRAVNEASRIELLCSSLDRPLLLSRDFAARCGCPTSSLGLHRLRGVEGLREICTVR